MKERREPCGLKTESTDDLTKKMDEKETNIKRKLTIVFDIDNTLCDSACLQDEERLYILRKSMLIFASGLEHQILPGTIELMQYLISKDYINLAFFSSGIKERNIKFVKDLLTKTVGPERYQDISSSIIILSRENLTPLDPWYYFKMYKNFGLPGGTDKKDISKAFVQGCSLKNAILVDDNLSFVQYGQEKNILRSPRGKTDYYSQLKEITPNLEFYEEIKEELFFKFNSLFYIAGVLSDCINQFEQEQDFTRLLFNNYYEKAKDSFFGFVPSYNYKWAQKHDYYDKGLACLKSINPALCFVSPEDYVHTLNTPATQEEQQLIDRSRVLQELKQEEHYSMLCK